MLDIKPYQEIRQRNFDNLKHVVETFDDPINLILDMYAIHGDDWLNQLDDLLKN